MNKKTLACVVSLIMAFMTACGDNAGEISQAPTNSQQSGESEQVVFDESEPGFARFAVDPVEPVEYEGNTKIVYFSNYNTKFITTEEDPRIYDEVYIENAVNEYLDEQGYDFYVDFVNNSELDILNSQVYTNFDTYETMLENGEQVDIVNTGTGLAAFGGSNNTYDLFVEKGYLEPLNDYFQTELGKTFYQQYAESYWQATADAQGNIYGKSASSMAAFPLILQLNEAMCEEYGIDADSINSLDDLEPHLQTLADENIQGLLLSSSVESYPHMVDFCEYNGIYVNAQTAQAENIFENEKAVQYLEKISQYKQNGYLVENEETAINYLCTIGSAWPVTQDSSKIISNGYLQSPSSNGVTGISSQSQHKDEAFQLLALLNTDSELATIVYSGIEGRNYVENDSVKSLNKNALPFYDVNGTMANAVITQVNPGDNPNKASDFELCNEYAEISPFYRFEITDTQLLAKLEELAAIYDEFYGVFYGDYGEYGDLETALAAANEQLKAAGIDEALAEVNRLYNEWKQ